METWNSDGSHAFTKTSFLLLHIIANLARPGVYSTFSPFLHGKAEFGIIWRLHVESKTGRSFGMRMVVIVIIGAALCGGVYYSSTLYSKMVLEPTIVPLNTGGTSNIDIIAMSSWRTAYRNAKGVDLHYKSTGSTKGIQGVVDKDFAIAFAHAPLSAKQREAHKAKGNEMVQIPIILCAVVPMYNVKELNDKPPLNFTADVLADIYMGNIKRWDHKDIQDLNKDVKLPPKDIIVVHREDSSGTTFIFTDYLHGASPAWAKKFGPASNEVKWPVGVSKTRNTGVRKHIEETDGAIGYVDLFHASGGAFPYGAVQNADKSEFIHAAAANMTAATKTVVANISEDLTFKLTNQPGKDAYPICGAIWAICYQTQSAADQKTVTEFLHWVLHDGQKSAASTFYAPLPEELVKRADERVKLIKAGS
jgi:phosphate transport system substrate-binding protein